MSGEDLRQWNEVLADAESSLRRAQREALQWREAIVLIRQKIREEVPWPAASQNGIGEKVASHQVKGVGW